MPEGFKGIFYPQKSSGIRFFFFAEFAEASKKGAADEWFFVAPFVLLSVRVVMSAL